MSFEFFGRLQKELSLTGNAVYESVVAVAERVNRKVHVLRLHGQAASLLTQIETVQGELGQQLAGALSRHFPARPSASPSDVERTTTPRTAYLSNRLSFKSMPRSVR
jgi:hypothetical protein